MKDSKGWDGKLRVGQRATIANEDAMEESDHSDHAPSAEEVELAEPAQPDEIDEGTFYNSVRARRSIAWYVSCGWRLTF